MAQDLKDQLASLKIDRSGDNDAEEGRGKKWLWIVLALIALGSVGGFFLQLEWGYVIAFVFFIITMFWKPEGLLSKRR